MGRGVDKERCAAVAFGFRRASAQKPIRLILGRRKSNPAGLIPAGCRTGRMSRHRILASALAPA
jgi:hypothetical protein